MASIIGDAFALTKKYSNLDVFYGPYTTIEEASVKVPEEIRDLGLTVGIKLFLKDENGNYRYTLLHDDFTDKNYYAYVYDEFIQEGEDKYSFFEIEEYLWKRNTTILERKGESSLILELITPNRIRISENIPILIRILGGLTPNSIEVYEVVNGQEFLTNYSYPGAIPLNSILSLNLNITGNPRTITYRIKVTDKNNLYALTAQGNNYLEVIIDYKEIALYNVNTNNIDSLTIKNANNLQGKVFSFNVSYISFILNYFVNLYIGDTLIENAIETTDTDSYRVTLPNNLNGFGGDDIKIKLNYVRSEEGGGTSNMELWYTIVTIMAKGVFSNIRTELNGNIFYIGNKVACNIYFEAESQETYLISSTNDSDFSYSGRIMSYTWNTIYINPENITTNPVFKFLIDGTKEVIVNTSEGSQIKNFTKGIYNDESRMAEDPRTELFKESHDKIIKSYILDIYCFINWSTSLDNIFLLGNITIDKQLIRFGNIAYPTPLLRDVHIGFEYQVTNINSNEQILDKIVYNALYIDGVLCKNLKVASEESGVSVNNILYSSDFVIKNINIYTNVNSNLYPFTFKNFPGSNKFIPILQNNYEYYVQKEDEQLNLPLLKLTALDLDDELYTLRNSILGKKKAIVPSKFGTLEDGQNKYATNIDASLGEYNILLKQRTSLKKALLKSRGILCYYEYGQYSGYTEVHTLGTSTLDYRLPNFKFTFLNNDMTTKKVNFVLGYNESVLTAKADYMDSSHLNNTPTATYYNKIIHSGFFDSEKQSPSAKLDGLDAITGIPIIMSIKDVGSENFINYGSFMLNIDKTGNALKFKVEDDIDECISFEGTSNAFDSGLSSRFEITSNVVQDFELLHNLLIDPNSQDSDFYSEIDDGDYIINKSELSENPTLRSVINVLNYLAEGLEYRYPDSDMIEEDDDFYIIMPFSQFKRLFSMFYWVANSSNLSESEYRTLFVQYFNYDYCALYFILLMVFALTDNVGKNCMFDQWFDPFGENNNQDCLWYPRPYDLDSQTGLDNNGYDGIAPFVEVSPQFSLNYLEIINEWDGVEDLRDYLDRYKLDVESTLDYPESTTPSLLGIAKRYSFSSSSSNLWFNFYKNFKNQIRETYRELRNYKVDNNLLSNLTGTNTLLSYESITSFYREMVLDKLGDSLYNLDFLLKYLGDVDSNGLSRLFFGLGNRWDKFTTWIKKRIQFCDIYFYYREFKVQLSTFNKEILLNSPLYVITRYDLPGSAETIHFFNGHDKVNMSISGDGTSSSGLKYVFYINPEAILEGNIYSSLLSSSPPMPFDSIISLDIDGTTLSDVVNIINASYLTSLRIRKLRSSYDKLLPANIKNIIVEDSTALLTVNDLPYLQSIVIKNCKAPGRTLTLLNLGTDLSPISLTIENSELNLELSNVKIGTFTFTNNTINNLVVNNCDIPSLTLKNLTIGTIGFSGDGSKIDIIDFRQSKFINSNLDLSTIAQNVKHLLLTDSSGLVTITSTNRFENLLFIGLMNSDIQNFVYTKSGENNTIDHFDGKLLPNILPKSLYCLKYNEVLYQTSDSFTLDILYSANLNNYYSGSAVATRAFNLELTKITKIINLVIYDSELGSSSLEGHTSNVTGITKLFTNCTNLISIENSDIRCSGVKMFKNCSNLTTFSNTTIKIGTTAEYMFATCNSLNYSYIDAILTNNPQITNFSNFLFNLSFLLDTTINLSKYGNALNMSAAFRLPIHAARGFTLSSAKGITITVIGNIPTSATTISSTFEIGTTNLIVFLNWSTLVKNCVNLTSMHCAFYNCKFNDYYNVSTEWFPTSNVLLSVEGLFASAKVKLLEGFKFKPNVINCKNTFNGCPTSDGYTFDVKNIFEDCNKLECAILCFYNNSWAYTSESLKLNSNLLKEVSLAGIFATSNSSNYPIVYGKIDGKFTSSNSTNYNGRTYTYSPPLGSATTSESGKAGIFQSRRVRIPNNSTVIYSSSSLANMFREATIIFLKENEEDANIFVVQLYSPNINRAFYNTSMNGATLEVLLSEVQQAIYAFGVSSKTRYTFPIENLICNPPTLPNTIINASYMFYGLSINEIPIDYFRLDGEQFVNLTNTSYMFYNTDITKLPFSNIYGLLPNSITEIDYMFDQCTKLKGGIPNNFFNNNNNLINLRGVFRKTGVLFGVNSNNLSLMSPLSLKNLTPNVTDVSNLFSYNFPRSLSNLQEIMYDCFENCKILTSLFYCSKELIYNSGYKLVRYNNGKENVNIFKVNSPINMQLTFVGLTSYINFDIDNLSSIKNITGIVHYLSTVSDNNPTSPNASNSIYNLLLQLLTSVYPNYLSLLLNVTLDSCLGKWAMNTDSLDSLSIPSTSNYLAVQYWYKPITAIPVGRDPID